MLKYRWLLFGLSLLMAACVVVVALALLLPPQSGVTKENFDRIQIGMTRAEVEQIFGIPGLGQTVFKAVQNRDVPVVMGAVFFGALLIGGGNLLADLAAARLDPRIRLAGEICLSNRKP